MRAKGLLLLAVLARSAQAGEAPTAAWSGSVGAGFALTGGNTDTATVNLTAGVTHDPKRSNVFKGDALYLRTDSGGLVSVDRISLGLRDEVKLDDGFFVFADLRYLSDRFKGVERLLSPQAGAGYRALGGPKLTLSIDAGAGAVFERLTGNETTTSAALNLNEVLVWMPSESARLSHKASALWKAGDLGDALYHLELALAATVTKRVELRVSLLDDYKTRPPATVLHRNDTAVVLAIVWKL